MPSVLMVPDWRTGNPYLSRLSEAVEHNSIDVYFGSPPPGFFKLTRMLLHHSYVSAIHIHWTRPLIGDILWSPSRTKVLVKMMLFTVDILICKFMRKRVVWTVHNIISHETENRTAECRARRILAILSDAVIVHSEQAKREVENFLGKDLSYKMSVIPHGHYLNDYPFFEHRYSSLKRHFEISEDTMNILYFGNIRPYKGVENLLSAFCQTRRTDARLLIAGKPRASELERQIQTTAQADQRIRLYLDFVPDDDVAALFRLADAVVLPFNQTLTSGSAILALGFGKPLLMPSRGSVLGLQNSPNVFFYANVEDLVTHLENIPSHPEGSDRDETSDGSALPDWEQVGSATATLYKSITVKTFSSGSLNGKHQVRDKISG